MDNQIALQILKDTRDILNNINVPYFLMGGTLLGFIRNDNFIPHDDDIDIGIFIENWSPKIIEKFQQNGFKWERKLGTNELGLEYTFLKNGIQLDIFFWYKEQDYYWYGAWWKENKPENIIKLKFNKFDTYGERFGNEFFNIPTDFNHWLEQIYGPDWRIPNPKWHWCASCKNIMQAPFDNKKEKTICLGMIVKNEAHIIKESLEAIKPIINYWIIIDTGSSDKTKEIIKEILKDIPGELIERPWINFGYNRSEVAKLTQNKADYTLMLDADEIMEINYLDKKLLIADYYRIKINDKNLSYYYDMLLNNKYEWNSIGVTHEYWTAKNANILEVLNGLEINHKCCGNYRKEKFERDRDLLLEGIKQEPNSTRYPFYLAQTYTCLGDYEKAIEWSQKRIEKNGWNEEIFYSLFTIVHCKIMLKKPFEEILEAMYKAYFYHPQSAEPLYEVLRYCREKKLFNIGYYIGKIAQQIPEPINETLFIRKTIYQYQILDELSICAYYIEKYKEAYEISKKIIIEDLYPVEEKIRMLSNYEYFKQKGEENV